MKTKIIALFSLLFLFGVVMISCDEESLLPKTPDHQSAEDNSVAETGVSRVFENVNNFGISEGGKKSIEDSVPVATWSNDSLYINFDGVEGLGGMIIAYFPNRIPGTPPLEGVTINVTIEDFVFDGTTMNGELNLNLTAFPGVSNPSGVPTFTFTSVGDLTFKKDTTTTWNGYRTLVWSEGFELNPLDIDPTDDVFLISGQSTGTNSKGKAYSVVIDENNPLRLDKCDYISKGIMTITEGEGEDQIEMTLNFGDGTCDSIMIVTINGVEIKIDMSQ